MSEPKAVATRIEPVVEGVYTWSVSDERIGGMQSCSTAVEEAPGSLVVIDPVRVEQGELDRLGQVAAILLTKAKHVRAAPHYREATGAAIWAPVQADLEVKADETFTEGNELPGGLKVIALPGPREPEYAFYLKKTPGVMIMGDALLNLEGADGFCILPKKYNPDPDKTRESCRKLLEYDFDVMLFGHGDPIRAGAKEKLRELLK